MTGQRPGGLITPTPEPWATLGLQWHCTLPDGSECDGSGGGMDADARGIWKAARAHHDATGHEVVIDRMQSIHLPPFVKEAKEES